MTFRNSPCHFGFKINSFQFLKPQYRDMNGVLLELQSNIYWKVGRRESLAKQELDRGLGSMNVAHEHGDLGRALDTYKEGITMHGRALIGFRAMTCLFGMAMGQGLLVGDSLI